MNKVEYFTDLAKSIEKDERRMNDDTISRQAAIDAIDRAVTKEAARWSLQELPSAERLGRWETEIRPEYDGKHATYACSVCGNMALDEFAYCPNCGADMRGEEE